METELHNHLTNRIPPVVIQTTYSCIISILVFYGHVILAFRMGSLMYSVYQIINVIFEILTEKILIKTNNTSWRAKFISLDRRIIKKTTFNNSFGDLNEFESSPLNPPNEEYLYEVRIPSSLCNNIDTINKFLFIPMYKIGILNGQYVYTQELIEFVRKCI